MIRKLERKDKDLFLRLTRDFYASDAVLHSIPDAYHINAFEEMMRSEQYAEGYLIEQDARPAGYALLAKTYSHECGGMVLWIEEIYIEHDGSLRELDSSIALRIRKTSLFTLIGVSRLVIL